MYGDDIVMMTMTMTHNDGDDNDNDTKKYHEKIVVLLTSLFCSVSHEKSVSVLFVLLVDVFNLSTTNVTGSLETVVGSTVVGSTVVG